MKKITSVKTGGYAILVEMLTQQEALCTDLALNVNNESQQAYIKHIGPLVDEKAGYKVGQRVVLQGSYVPVPNPSKSDKKWGVVDMHNIRAILEEKEEK